jgi:hypothetical protein
LHQELEQTLHANLLPVARWLSRKGDVASATDRELLSCVQLRFITGPNHKLGTRMNPKYAIKQLNGGWVVMMASNGQILSKWYDTDEAAACVRDQFERGEITADKKEHVWLVAEAFVCEPCLGAMIGEVGALDMRQYNVVERLTQLEFDALMNEARDEDGCYPDT